MRYRGISQLRRKTEREIAADGQEENLRHVAVPEAVDSGTDEDEDEDEEKNAERRSAWSGKLRKTR